MTMQTLMDRGWVRRRIMLFAGLMVMLLAVVHRMWPGVPLGSDWLGLVLYLCGATVTVLAAWPRAPSADRPGPGAA